MESRREPSLEPEHSEGDIPAAQEASFVNRKTLIIAGVGLLAAIIFIHIFAFLILLPFLRGEDTAALPEARITPAGPPLQVNPSGDLARLRATQQANLNENAQVPIDQAMEMILENGLPAALSGESTGEAEVPAGKPDSDLVQQGEAVFQDQGCGSCHTQANTALAPTLVGIFGGQVTLQGGETVSVDEVYLHQSIVDPHSQIVEGYSAVMPDIYEQRLSEEEITALVEYIKSLGD